MPDLADFYPGFASKWIDAAAGGIPTETEGPLATSREWATDVRGFAIDSGHYLAEEAPEATAKALIEFFAAA